MTLDFHSHANCTKISGWDLNIENLFSWKALAFANPDFSACTFSIWTVRNPPNFFFSEDFCEVKEDYICKFFKYPYVRVLTSFSSNEIIHQWKNRPMDVLKWSLHNPSKAVDFTFIDKTHLCLKASTAFFKKKTC